MAGQHSHTALSSILLILVLYLLQGFNLGLTFSVPILLTSRGVTWKDLGTYNFAVYPFSFKLLWAPLIDALYFRRFGRRKSWLIPIQICMAIIFFVLSIWIESFFTEKAVLWLTSIFFGIVWLTATQDICVDGLAITLFSNTNPQWASTSQAIGQTLGRSLGFSFTLTLESANFTNRFIREPLSIEPQSYGLLSFESFMRFVGILYLIVTTCIGVFLRETDNMTRSSEDSSEHLSLKKSYLSVLELCKMKSFRQLVLFTLLAPVGLVATNTMTSVALTE